MNPRNSLISLILTLAAILAPSSAFAVENVTEIVNLLPQNVAKDYQTLSFSQVVIDRDSLTFTAELRWVSVNRVNGTLQIQGQIVLPQNNNLEEMTANVLAFSDKNPEEEKLARVLHFYSMGADKNADQQTADLLDQVMIPVAKILAKTLGENL